MEDSRQKKYNLTETFLREVHWIFINFILNICQKKKLPLKFLHKTSLHETNQFTEKQQKNNHDLKIIENSNFPFQQKYF